MLSEVPEPEVVLLPLFRCCLLLLVVVDFLVDDEVVLLPVFVVRLPVVWAFVVAVNAAKAHASKKVFFIIMYLFKNCYSVCYVAKACHV